MSAGAAGTAATPKPPSINERLQQIENTSASHTDGLNQTDRVLANLVAQISELRIELGLPPLDADYFNTAGGDPRLP